MFCMSRLDQSASDESIVAAIAASPHIRRQSRHAWRANTLADDYCTVRRR